MELWEVVHIEQIQGFDIILSITPEEEEPTWDFETEEDRLKLIEDINDGTLLYFVTKVAAYRHGIELC